MITLDLNGNWILQKEGDNEIIPATVPGCAHTDLLSAKKITDPFYRDNEDKQMWIGESNWIYSRKFFISSDVLTQDSIELVCDGLDTFAKIFINGKLLGKANNQFRRWEYNIKPFIHQGENSIEILFESTIPYIQKKQKERFLGVVGGGRMAGGNWIRKEQCQYGWDWGPICITCGIWRSIKIRAYNTGRLDNIHFIQSHTKNKVKIDATISVIKVKKTPLHLISKLSFEGKLIEEKVISFKENEANIAFEVTSPELWWPNGMGKQALYDIELILMDSQQTMLDKKYKKLGLRTLFLEMKNDKWGQSFQFVVNGKAFFAKGANWIPADAFVTRITPDRYEYLIKSAADANMNMLRVWGGGIYESDIFYDLCDKYGLCVWQDFMFACSAYPSFEGEYLQNVRVEIEQNIKRLRHHACLALWCGNNEIEQQWDFLIGNNKSKGQITFQEYKKIFDVLIPNSLKTLDPKRSYIPSSPYNPVGNRKDTSNPNYGDAHLWSVWHERQPFEWYWTREDRFNSEFGFQSFPEPLTVSSYATDEDKNVTSYIMEKHQRSVIGNDAIMQYMIDWFKLPKNFDMTLWLSQILQGMAIKYAVENWRRKKPKGMGTLYWQLNDCWPVASWSSIDYFGNWKAFHYMAKRFFAPLLISGIENKETSEADIYISNDLFENVEGKILWTLTNTKGKKLASDAITVNIPQNISKKFLHLNLKDFIDKDTRRNALLWLDLLVNGKVISSNFISFVRPKHLELQKPSFITKLIKRKSDFLLTISSNTPALWVWADVRDMQASYSDRFFHLTPGFVKEVIITPQAEISLNELKTNLSIYSLYDTWS